MLLVVLLTFDWSWSWPPIKRFGQDLFLITWWLCKILLVMVLAGFQEGWFAYFALLAMDCFANFDWSWSYSVIKKLVALAVCSIVMLIWLVLFIFCTVALSPIYRIVLRAFSTEFLLSRFVKNLPTGTVFNVSDGLREKKNKSDMFFRIEADDLSKHQPQHVGEASRQQRLPSVYR
jgi:hypothetical protein